MNLKQSIIIIVKIQKLAYLVICLALRFSILQQLHQAFCILYQTRYKTEYSYKLITYKTIQYILLTCLKLTSVDKIRLGHILIT